MRQEPGENSSCERCRSVLSVISGTPRKILLVLPARRRSRRGYGEQIMSLGQSHTVLIAAGALVLLAACSRSPETGQASRTAQSQTAQPAQTPGPSGSSQNSGDLACPIVQGGQVRGTLEETSREIDNMGQQLGSGGADEISTAVARLRSRHPNASAGAVANYLITGYCPIINARSGMSADEKKQALRAFATQARKIAGMR